MHPRYRFKRLPPEAEGRYEYRGVTIYHDPKDFGPDRWFAYPDGKLACAGTRKALFEFVDELKAGEQTHTDYLARRSRQK